MSSQTRTGLIDKLGFTFDPKFTDETATQMIVSDDAFVMLLVESKFKEFIKKELVDATRHTEVVCGFHAGPTQRSEPGSGSA